MGLPDCLLFTDCPIGSYNPYYRLPSARLVARFYLLAREQLPSLRDVTMIYLGQSSCKAVCSAEDLGFLWTVDADGRGDRMRWMGWGM